ncbi:MAG: AIR synthase related protein [Candidatus Thorarchaeota archaeon]
MNLEELVRFLLDFEGISRKFVLPSIINKLRRDSYGGDVSHTLGEDSAAIGTDCDDFILLTTDAIVEDLCMNKPHAAGFNVVLANVMDIYAAGGVPNSFAVALSYSDPHIGEMMLQGLIDASHAFRVPIVRGHTNSASTSTYVVGSSTGSVLKEDLLTAGGALPDDALVLIFDNVGNRGRAYDLGWDSVTGCESSVIVERLSVMNDLARKHLLNASKDVSVAGLVGTAGMLVEYSGKGGVIDIDAVDASRPRSIPLKDWLRMYISLGFLVSIARGNINAVRKVAEDHGMTITVVGDVDDSTSLRLRRDSEEVIIFDFSKGPILTPRS